MNIIKHIIGIVSVAALTAAPLGLSAADQKAAKPYKLETCAVTGEELGGMGKPFVFEHEGQEIKLCCKSCKKDFDKDPAKYIKKMQEAEKKVEADKAKK